MPVKLIIWIPGKPSIHGHKRREFLWSPAHNCYLYEGKEVDPTAFNAKYEKAMKNNADLLPRVKVIQFEDAKAVPPISDPLTPPVPPSIDEQLDQAEAVIMRYAPERLKKKTGPKPPAAANVEV